MPNTASPAMIVPTPRAVRAEKPVLRLRMQTTNSHAAAANSKVLAANMACLLQTVPPPPLTYTYTPSSPPSSPSPPSLPPSLLLLRL